MLSHFSHVQLFATLWMVACQVYLSVEFSRQEYWSGLPFHSPGDLPDAGIKSESLMSPALAGGFFTTSATILIPWALKTENLPHLEPDVEQKKRVREIPSIGRNQHLQDLRELSSSWGLQLTVTRQWELQLYSSGMELCSNGMNLEADSSKPSERYLTSPTLWFRTQLNLCPSLSCITALSWLRGLCNPAAQGYPEWLSHSEEFWQNMVH